MVDYAMDIYREVHGENATIPQDMEDQKAGVFKLMEELTIGQAKFEELCMNEELRVSLVFDNLFVYIIIYVHRLVLLFVVFS